MPRVAGDDMPAGSGENVNPLALSPSIFPQRSTLILLSPELCMTLIMVGGGVTCNFSSPGSQAPLPLLSANTNQPQLHSCLVAASVQPSVLLSFF